MLTVSIAGSSTQQFNRIAPECFEGRLLDRWEESEHGNRIRTDNSKTYLAACTRLFNANNGGSNRISHRTRVMGVFYDPKGDIYLTSNRIMTPGAATETKQVQNYFSVKKLGDKVAREQAIKWRQLHRAGELLTLEQAELATKAFQVYRDEMATENTMPFHRVSTKPADKSATRSATSSGKQPLAPAANNENKNSRRVPRRKVNPTDSTASAETQGVKTYAEALSSTNAENDDAPENGTGTDGSAMEGLAYL